MTLLATPTPLSQEAIVGAVDATAARKAFDLTLPDLGPYCLVRCHLFLLKAETSPPHNEETHRASRAQRSSASRIRNRRTSRRRLFEAISVSADPSAQRPQDFSPNGRLLTIGGRRGHLALLDWSRPRVVAELQARLVAHRLPSHSCGPPCLDVSYRLHNSEGDCLTQRQGASTLRRARGCVNLSVTYPYPFLYISARAGPRDDARRVVPPQHKLLRCGTGEVRSALLVVPPVVPRCCAASPSPSSPNHLIQSFFNLHSIIALRYVYIYDKRGLEVHCLKEHTQPRALTFLRHFFLLCSIGEQGVLRYQARGFRTSPNGFTRHSLGGCAHSSPR